LISSDLSRKARLAVVLLVGYTIVSSIASCRVAMLAVCAFELVYMLSLPVYHMAMFMLTVLVKLHMSYSSSRQVRR